MRNFRKKRFRETLTQLCVIESLFSTLNQSGFTAAIRGVKTPSVRHTDATVNLPVGPCAELKMCHEAVATVREQDTPSNHRMTGPARH